MRSACHVSARGDLRCDRGSAGSARAADLSGERRTEKERGKKKGDRKRGKASTRVTSAGFPSRKSSAAPFRFTRGERGLSKGDDCRDLSAKPSPKAERRKREGTSEFRRNSPPATQRNPFNRRGTIVSLFTLAARATSVRAVIRARGQIRARVIDDSRGGGTMTSG